MCTRTLPPSLPPTWPLISFPASLSLYPCVAEHLPAKLRLSLAPLGSNNSITGAAAALEGELLEDAADGVVQWRRVSVRALPGRYVLSAVVDAAYSSQAGVAVRAWPRMRPSLYCMLHRPLVYNPCTNPALYRRHAFLGSTRPVEKNKCFFIRAVILGQQLMAS